MEKSIMDEIFFENDLLSEKVKYSDDHKKFSEESLKYYDKLKSELNEEQWMLFEKFTEADFNEGAEAEIAFFKTGFKMGIKLAVECLK